MTGEYQRELFGEFKEEKGKFEKIADKIARRKQRLGIHVPLENIVFAGIIFILCVVVAFALGIERGKRYTKGLKLEPLAAREEETVIVSEEKKNAPRIELATIEIAQIRREDEPAAKPVKNETAAEPKDLPYTIQLIAYKKKPLAERERDRLLDKKIGAFIIPSGKWYQICAGAYGNMQDAKRALAGFSEKYKGCFIRRR